MSSSAKTFDTSVFTAMDAWFDTCRVLIGGALFEYAFIIRLSQNSKANAARVGMPSRKNVKNGKPTEERCKTYDRSAFTLFNSIFLVFCVVYGTICLSQ